MLPYTIRDPHVRGRVPQGFSRRDGTSPLFFLLLIKRDILGIDDEAQAQQHTAAEILLFLVSATGSVAARRLWQRHEFARFVWGWCLLEYPAFGKFTEGAWQSPNRVSSSRHGCV